MLEWFAMCVGVLFGVIGMLDTDGPLVEPAPKAATNIRSSKQEEFPTWEHVALAQGFVAGFLVCTLVFIVGLGWIA